MSDTLYKLTPDELALLMRYRRGDLASGPGEHSALRCPECVCLARDPDVDDERTTPTQGKS